MCNWDDCGYGSLLTFVAYFRLNDDGIILQRLTLKSGTGTNAAYVEAAKHVEHSGKMPNSATHIAINTEWGAFGERNELEFIRTYYDRILDDYSPNPDHQMQVLFKRFNILNGWLRKLTIF